MSTTKTTKLLDENGLSHYSTILKTTFATKTELAGLVNSAPETLDTLKELASALGDDANFSSTVTTALGNRYQRVSGKSGDIVVFGDDDTLSDSGKTIGVDIPEPASGEEEFFLKADGTWAKPTDTVTTILLDGDEGTGVATITCNSDGKIVVTKKNFAEATDVDAKADASSITAGIAGSKVTTSGVSFTIPYLEVSSQGIVTAYGVRTHNIAKTRETLSSTGDIVANTIFELTNTYIAGSGTLNVYLDGILCKKDSFFSEVKNMAGEAAVLGESSKYIKILDNVPSTFDIDVIIG